MAAPARKERREIERFRAVSDDGHETEIVVCQTFIHALAFGGQSTVIPGLLDAQTVDGLDANIEEDGTYTIVNDPFRPMPTVRRVR